MSVCVGVFVCEVGVEDGLEGKLDANQIMEVNLLNV